MHFNLKTFPIQKPLKIEEDQFYVVSLLWEEIELDKGNGSEWEPKGLRWYGGLFGRDKDDYSQAEVRDRYFVDDF